METRTIDRMTGWIAGTAIVLVAISFLFSVERGLGTMAGAALAIGNWTATRFFAARLMRASALAGMRLSSLLVVKVGFVLAVAAAMVRVFDATGLIVGVSAMVIGIVLGALHAHLSFREEEGEGPVGLAPAKED